MCGNPSAEGISTPGASWRMLWTDNLREFQLDIVGFLAILGEGSISSTAQVSALSCLFYLPRLIPAPQALLRTTRPNTLPSEAGTVTAIHSGNVKEHIPHVANVLLDREMPPFTVRCVSVTIDRSKEEEPITTIDTLFRGQPRAAKVSRAHRRLPLVKLKALGPLPWVTLLGFFVSLALVIISIALGDGMSLIATILLSSLSTMVGLSNKWELLLPRKYTGRSRLPRGDVVIRFPNKSFLVVFCEEFVARELFWAGEEITYHIESATAYRLISLVGTLMLMLGVVILANAKLPLKFCWTGAYLLLNASHWAVAALPQRLHWDLSAFQVEEHGITSGQNNESYMDALGKAIMVTKSIDRLRLGKAVPFTNKWDDWLAETERVANAYDCRPGKVFDRLWKDKTCSKVGTVYDVPLADCWTARGSWDMINGCTNKPSGPPVM